MLKSFALSTSWSRTDRLTSSRCVINCDALYCAWLSLLRVEDGQWETDRQCVWHSMGLENDIESPWKRRQHNNDNNDGSNCMQNGDKQLEPANPLSVYSHSNCTSTLSNTQLNNYSNRSLVNAVLTTTLFNTSLIIDGSTFSSWSRPRFLKTHQKQQQEDNLGHIKNKIKWQEDWMLADCFFLIPQTTLIHLSLIQTHKSHTCTLAPV